MANVRELDPGASPLNYLGAELRRLREAAGLTLEDLGGIVFCTGSLISQFETARKVPRPEFLERADVALGADGALLRLWELVKRSGLPAWVHEYVRLEAEATTIYTFQAQVVHGLLQTEDYARAVLRSAGPAETLEERVAARMARQRILAGGGSPLIWIILDEGVLHRPVGGPECMRTQLAHLLSCREATSVNVQVLPFAAGAHHGLTGSFTLLTFEDAPHVTYSETYESNQLSVDPKAVAAGSFRYDHLQAAALSLDASAELMARVMEDLHEHRSEPGRRTVG
ncbi:XRE family transcriptional regulator [Streptomyces abyssalis]|uniref:XRE family transcriptional regulator n=1 Tax=Streptomyces abyssalis TaxID=933944 RepID=A0A1E7JLQ7_9ACTN|nr:helix-turn-helix transcriptional regulator [Streptomyces abyssalis]OEU87644.1 XRE family transcriptional regulator [Streptomyces abyssalis]OEU88576.1 XRE family transcriptional regulator [Streptomyces abyssalis]OEV05532.1 XRE family transcriptional regulator [Streptomyces nanshensis]